MPVRYAAYIRKSQEDSKRQVLSLPSQLAECENLAAQLGVTITEVIEESHSAWHPGRPKFDKLMARVNKGEISGVIAWHPNRLSRNEVDAGTVCYLIRQGCLDVRFCSYSFEPSAEGIMMLQN